MEKIKQEKQKRKYIKKKNIKRETIKAKMLLLSLSIFIGSLCMITSISVYLNYKGIMQSLEQTLTESVEIAAQRVDNRLCMYRTLAMELASRNIFQELITKETMKKEVIEELSAIKKRHDFTIVDITDKDGMALLGKVNIGDRDYFQVAKETGKPYVADLTVRKDNGEVTLIVSAPIIENNEFQGILMLGMDATFLCDLVTSIQVGESGSCTIIDKEGTAVAYRDTNYILEQWNTIEKAKSDKSLKGMAEVDSKKLKGEVGFDEYRYNGKKKLTAYAPIPNTNGWTIDINVNKKEFIGNMQKSIYITIVMGILISAIAVYAFIKLSNKIASPIKVCAERLALLAQGDLTTPVPKVETNDETAVLAESTSSLVTNLSELITDMSNVLGEISSGNLAVDSERIYPGDFAPIKSAVNNIIDALNTTIKGINESAEQVLNGSAQVAEGATDLAEGATEQASIVEEFIASIEEVSAIINKSVQEAEKTSEIAYIAKEKANQGTQTMENLLHAIDHINKSSSNVAEVIKVIDDIASQTNLLALNAAIESARAGEAGKGFAVVANEIRTLANRSSDTVKEIQKIINESSSSVQEGQQMADDTAIVFKDIVNVIDETANIAKVLVQNSELQKTSTNELLQGTNQLSSIVESNSANSEESAAVSEELTAQADNLNKLIDYFQLKV